MEDQARGSRLIIASNRLPVVVGTGDDGRWLAAPAGAGGLVTALGPVLRDRGGVWVGWAGAADIERAQLEPLLGQLAGPLGYTLKPVELTAQEREQFYLGFTNQIIWPLFHDLQTRCNFEPGYWDSYVAVNRKFAAALAEAAGSGDFIWVHDYHLMNVAANLRELGVAAPLGFFLHIPFPPLDIFLKLPWRRQIMEGLLEHDRIGFQTRRDLRNFLACAQALCPQAQIETAEDGLAVIRAGGHAALAFAIPISIDVADFARRSGSPEVLERVEQVREALGDQTLIFGVDRLDYTKGIPERLLAFRHALRRYPDLIGQVTLIQAVVPSRTDILEYSELKAEIDGLVGEINSEFTRLGWVPIHYLYRHLEDAKLLAYYRSADMALVTPLKDGMNLVAKEYCVCNAGTGALILSEFAGAAAQLHAGALLVNPYDMEGVAAALYRAWTMPEAERRTRMERLKAEVAGQDLFWWVETFLDKEA